MSEPMTSKSLRPSTLTFVVINGEPMSYGYSTNDDQPKVPFKSPLTKQQMDGSKIMFLQPDDDDWEDFYQQYDDDAWDCDLCGGEGFREYNDAPEEWGEDCPSEPNHLIPCRGCEEIERDKYRAMAKFMYAAAIRERKD